MGSEAQVKENEVEESEEGEGRDAKGNRKRRYYVLWERKWKRGIGLLMGGRRRGGRLR